MIFNIRSDTYSNARKDIYIASKDTIDIDDFGNEIVKYKKPFYFGKKNYQPLNWRSAQAYMEVYGERKNNVIQLLIDSTEKNKIKEFDKVYLYGANPKNERVYGENANYVVKAVREQNVVCMVILEQIIKTEV